MGSPEEVDLGKSGDGERVGETEPKQSPPANPTEKEARDLGRIASGGANQ
jgi:hypothetical protein